MDVELKIWRNLETLDLGKWKVQPKEWKWLKVRVTQVYICAHKIIVFIRFLINNMYHVSLHDQ